MADDPLSRWNEMAEKRAAAYEQQADQSPKGGLAGIDERWLALAKGFLSPTKTGSFGESVGNAASALEGPLKALKTQQENALDKASEIRKAQAEIYLKKQKLDQGSDDDDPYGLKAMRGEVMINNMYKMKMKPHEDIKNNILLPKEKRDAAEAELQRLEEEKQQRLSDHYVSIGKRPAGQPAAARPQQPAAQATPQASPASPAPASPTPPRITNDAGEIMELQNGQWVKVK